MGKIFDLSFLTLCAVFSQEMVAAFDGNTELSSVLHTRQKRMNSEPGGSSSSHRNLPTCSEDMRKVNMESPTLVEITSSENSTNPGYAIHPHFILTRRAYTLQGFRVFVPMIDSGILQRQPVRACSGNSFGDVVLIELTNPIMLNNPVNRPFSSEHYPNRATAWAKARVQDWILYYEPHFNPRPQQTLEEVRFYDPTKVVMTQNGERIGHGFAIHPFIVLASRDFIRETVGVSSYTETAGELKPRRVKYILFHADVGLVRLRNPVSLTVPVPGAFVTENFSRPGVTWAEITARNWIRDILNG